MESKTTSIKQGKSVTAIKSNPVDKSTKQTDIKQASSTVKLVSKSTPKQATDTPKIIKVTKQTDQSKSLTAFIKSLGISEQLELYSYSNLTYIRADLLLQILSVDIKWFLKNSESPLHYITVNNITHINRYGMIKLIAQSKEPIALRLQDYLCELFYQVETYGSVKASDLQSRDAFISAVEEELKVYKSIDHANKTLVSEAQEATQSLRCDIAVLEANVAKLQEQCDNYSHANEELTSDVEHYKTIADKLARYVRVKSKNPINEAFDDNLIQYEDDEVSELQLVKEAIEAKELLKKAKKVTVKSGKSTGNHTTPIPGQEIYILRSSRCIDDDQMTYTWSVSDVEPDDEYVEESRLFLEGSIDNTSYDDIIYRIINVSQEKKEAILLVLSVNDGIYDEPTIVKLIS